MDPIAAALAVIDRRLSEYQRARVSRDLPKGVIEFELDRLRAEIAALAEGFKK